MEEPTSSCLCCFALIFDRHAKSLAFNFNAYSSSCTLLIVVQIHQKPIWSMRNSDPRVSVVFVQRPNSDLNSIFTMQIIGCNFQYGSSFGVTLDPTSGLRCFFVTWKSVFTIGRCTELWEFCSVFRHEILSDCSNIQESCIHTKFTQSVLLW